MKEEWKELAEYPMYKISNLGNIYSKKSKKLLTQVPNKKGYLSVCLYADGKPFVRRVNRLVAMAFIPNCCNLPEVNHLDGCKSNNRVDNLEWCNHLQNMQHAYKNNLIPKRKANKGSFKKGVIPANSKKVNQYSLDGVLLKTYVSANEANRANNYSHTTIQRYCNGERKCKNYIWKYADK